MDATIKDFAYPAGAGYADTVAVLDDGRRLYVNTQYREVTATHSHGCEKGQCAGSLSNVCEESARRRSSACTCGALDGVNDSAVISEARKRGRFGTPPRPAVVSSEKSSFQEKMGFGWCKKCESYCYGDCEAGGCR